MRIYCEDTKETCNNYQEYLRTLHWVKLKRRYKESKLCNDYCEICNTHKNEKIMHVHHKSYKRIGKEKLGDLALLCEDCHNELHKRYNQAVKENKNISKINRWSLVKKIRKEYNRKKINKQEKKVFGKDHSRKRKLNVNNKEKNKSISKNIEGKRKNNIIIRKNK